MSSAATSSATNSAGNGSDCCLSLLEIVEFKWLMAGDGHRVHVERLQAEPGYAQQCLCSANGSRIPALREAANRLAERLGVALDGDAADVAPHGKAA